MGQLLEVTAHVLALFGGASHGAMRYVWLFRGGSATLSILPRSPGREREMRLKHQSFIWERMNKP
jgi:hypothetical protein